MCPPYGHIVETLKRFNENFFSCIRIKMPRQVKRVPMAPWTIRITTGYEGLQGIVEFISDKELTSGTYVLGYETKSKDGSPAAPHFHGYFESIMTQQQIREKMREMGYSRRYSISPPKSHQFMCPTYCGYCIKQGTYVTQNIPDELIESWKVANEKILEDMKKDAERKKEKSFYKKVKMWLVEERDWGPRRASEMSHKNVIADYFGTAQLLVSDIMDYHLETKTPIRRNTVFFIAQALMCQWDEGYRVDMEVKIARDLCDR